MIPRLPLALLVILIAAVAFGFLSRTLNTRKTPIYAWILIVMTFAFLRPQDIDFSANFTRLVNFVVALAILNIYWSENRAALLLQDYRTIMMPIAVIGIITVIVAIGAPGLFSLVQSGSQRMFTLAGVFNYSVPLVADIGVPRPMGFFWEPGVFAVHLNILLFILFSKREHVLPISIILLAIMLTQSTTGISVALAQAVYFILSGVLRRRLKRNELRLFLISLVLAPVIAALAMQNISDKIFGVSAGSFIARSFDLVVAMQVIEDNPLIGIGFSQRAYMTFAGGAAIDISTLSKIDQNGRFNTNGVMILLYSTGIPLGLMFVFGLFRQQHFPNPLMFGLSILALLFSSPLSFTPLFVALAFSGLIIVSPRGKINPAPEAVLPIFPKQTSRSTVAHSEF